MKTYGLTLKPLCHSVARVLFITLALSLGLMTSVHAHTGNEISTGDARSVTEINQLDDDWGVEDLKKIIRRVAPAVVIVQALNEQGEVFSLGSGFVIQDDGLIVTNYHVVKYAVNITVKTKSGGVYAGLGLVGFDVERDVAVLKVNAYGLPTVALGDAHGAEVGDPVIAIGHPLGLEHTVSTGIISQKRRLESNEVLQHTASISSGNSGGPLLGADGRVIGINTSTIVDGQNLNFAMPIYYVEEILQGGTRVRHDFDDVATWQIERDITAYFDLYEDAQGRFSLAYPNTWLVEHEGYWSEDRTVSYEYTMFAPETAIRHDVLGYLSEGIRIQVQEPKEGLVFTIATLDEYGPHFVEGVLNTNAGFALTRSDTIHVGGHDAHVYDFVGENENIPEPEKCTFIVLADQHRRLIIEMVRPVSMLAAYDDLYVMLMSTFQTESLSTASN